MNALLITRSGLYGNGGGIYASRAHINAIAELVDKLTVIYPYKENKPAQKISPQVELMPYSYKKPKLLKYVDILMGRIHRHYKLSSDYFDRSKYDLVIFDSCVVSYRLIKKFRQNGIKIITIHHNYQIEYTRDNTRMLLWLPMMFWTYFAERDAVRYSDLNITLTQQDADLLKKHYDSKARYGVLGTFEFERKIPVVLNESKSQKNFLITGNLGAKQTEESIIPWIKNYYPVFKEVVPDAKLTLAGKNPSSHLCDLCNKNGIEVIDSPADMNPILNNATYYLCVTALGGGMKLRVMDGLKFGLPVLTHEVSARGYDRFVDKGIVYTYKDKLSFKDSLNKLINMKFDNNHILQEYESFFSFESGKERLKMMLKHL